MAPEKKPTDELKSHRTVIMMTPSEIELIDDWMFANRIKSRGEAIRKMCWEILTRDKSKIRDAEFKRAMDAAALENVEG